MTRHQKVHIQIMGLAELKVPFDVMGHICFKKIVFYFVKILVGSILRFISRSQCLAVES